MCARRRAIGVGAAVGGGASGVLVSIICIRGMRGGMGATQQGQIGAKIDAERRCGVIPCSQT